MKLQHAGESFVSGYDFIKQPRRDFVSCGYHSREQRETALTWQHLCRTGRAGGEQKFALKSSPLVAAAWQRSATLCVTNLLLATGSGHHFSGWKTGPAEVKGVPPMCCEEEDFSPWFGARANAHGGQLQT